MVRFAHHVLTAQTRAEESLMTTTTLTMVGMPPARPFSSEECAALVRAGIIGPEELADVLTGCRRFTVDQYLAMGEAGILYKCDRVELIDGVIIIMPPIGDCHAGGTDWITSLLVPPLIGRATVRMAGPIYLNDHSAPQPDAVLKRWNSPGSGRLERTTPDNVYLVIEFADSSLAYDRGAKLARYAAAGISEVWVANLRAQEVTSYAEPNGAEYAAVRTYRAGESISPRAFPDVVLAVSDFMPPAGPDTAEAP